MREGYGVDHPKARIDVCRYNSASIRVRIIDAGFADLGVVEREELIWPIIRRLPEDTRAQLSFLLLITPKERRTSAGSLEFDNPEPSNL